MKKYQNIKVLIIIAIIFPFFLTSCVTSRRSRGSLSDAFESSQEEDPSDRVIDPPEDDDDYWYFERDDDVYISIEIEPENEPARERDEEPEFEQPSAWGVQVNTKKIFNNDLKESRGFTVPIGMSINSDWSFLKFGISAIDYYSSNPDYSVSSDMLFNLSLSFEQRWVVDSQDNFLFLDIFTNIGTSYNSWDYNNPIYYGNERITGDSIVSYFIEAGLGINIWNKKNLRLIIDPFLGFNLFNYQTYEGFSNDVFRSYLYGGVMVKLLYINL